MLTYVLLAQLALPIFYLSPGDTIPGVTRDRICPEATILVMPMPEGLRNEVIRRYGLNQFPDSKDQYVVDQVVPTELGGTYDVKNLFPHAYANRRYTLVHKTFLEHTLHTLYCAGTVDLETAQQALIKNWVAAYEKYVGAFPPE